MRITIGKLQQMFSCMQRNHNLEATRQVQGSVVYFVFETRSLLTELTSR